MLANLQLKMRKIRATKQQKPLQLELLMRIIADEANIAAVAAAAADEVVVVIMEAIMKEITEVNAMIQTMNSLGKDQLNEDEAVDMEAEADVAVIVAVQTGDSDRKTIIPRSLKLKMIRTSIVPTVQRLVTTSII